MAAYLGRVHISGQLCRARSWLGQLHDATRASDDGGWLQKPSGVLDGCHVLVAAVLRGRCSVTAHPATTGRRQLVRHRSTAVPPAQPHCLQRGFHPPGVRSVRWRSPSTSRRCLFAAPAAVPHGRCFGQTRPGVLRGQSITHYESKRCSVNVLGVPTKTRLESRFGHKEV